MLRRLTVITIPSNVIYHRAYFPIRLRKLSNISQGRHLLKMPRITDATYGTVDKWLKSEGEQISAKDSICTVTLEGLTIEVNTGEDGYLADIIAQVGDKIRVDDPIALYVTDRDALMEFIEGERTAAKDEELGAIVDEALSVKPPKFDSKSLLREIKNLIQNGTIEDGSEFSKKLLSLARKGNPELLAAFEASYEDEKHSRFDHKFFLENARDVVSDSK